MMPGPKIALLKIPVFLRLLVSISVFSWVFFGWPPSFDFLPGIPEASAATLNIALVVGDPAVLDANTDVPLRDHLQTTLGHTVTLKDDADSTWDPTTFDVVVISESVGSSATAWLKTQVVGILTVEGSNYDEFCLGTAGTSDLGADTDINITNNSHYITAVFPLGVRAATTVTTNLGSMSGWVTPVTKLAH